VHFAASETVSSSSFTIAQANQRHQYFTPGGSLILTPKSYRDVKLCTIGERACEISAW
jgi:hypothetical protein